MTLREIPKANVLAALDQSPTGSILGRCRTALANDKRESFTATESPANALKKSLEVKYRIARTKGKELEGGDEVLLALGELGDKPVTGVFVDDDPLHYMIYLRAWTLEPVSAVIMEDPPNA